MVCRTYGFTYRTVKCCGNRPCGSQKVSRQVDRRSSLLVHLVLCATKDIRSEPLELQSLWNLQGNKYRTRLPQALTLLLWSFLGRPGRCLAFFTMFNWWCFSHINSQSLQLFFIHFAKLSAHSSLETVISLIL